jgi:hypothetical protein
VVAALPERLELRLGNAVAAVVGEALLRVPAARSLPGELRHQPLGLRAPQLHAEATREPVGIAHVIRVEVGDDDADDGAIRELTGEQGFPQVARRRKPGPRVDRRDAALVVEQPEVDVVERERQRHPQPPDAGCDQGGRAALGRLRPRMHDAGGRGAYRQLRLCLHASHLTGRRGV